MTPRPSMNFHGQKPSVQGAGGAQLIVCCHSVAVLLVENPDSRGSATSVSELSSLGGLAAKHGQDDLHTYTNPSQMLGPRLGKLPESLSIPRLHVESPIKRSIHAGLLVPGPAGGLCSPVGIQNLQEGLLGGSPLSTFLSVGRGGVLTKKLTTRVTPFLSSFFPVLLFSRKLTGTDIKVDSFLSSCGARRKR